MRVRLPVAITFVCPIPDVIVVPEKSNPGGPSRHIEKVRATKLQPLMQLETKLSQQQAAGVVDLKLGKFEVGRPEIHR